MPRRGHRERYHRAERIEDGTRDVLQMGNIAQHQHKIEMAQRNLHRMGFFSAYAAGLYTYKNISRVFDFTHDEIHPNALMYFFLTVGLITLVKGINDPSLTRHLSIGFGFGVLTSLIALTVMEYGSNPVSMP